MELRDDRDVHAPSSRVHLSPILTGIYSASYRTGIQLHLQQLWSSLVHLDGPCAYSRHGVLAGGTLGSILMVKHHEMVGRREVVFAVLKVLEIVNKVARKRNWVGPLGPMGRVGDGRPATPLRHSIPRPTASGASHHVW